jgi:hypothetical protein
MSATATPISPARFAAALQDLPISSIYAKAAELTNAITHLRASNTQLAAFAASGDADCAEAMRENEDVIARMEERIQLCRAEVEGNRGLVWEVERGRKMVIERSGEGETAARENGDVGGREEEDGDGGVYL